MKLSIISVLAIFSSAALARDYYDGHLYEARSDVLEAREAYIDAIDEYNFLAARGIVDKLKNLTPACVCYPNFLARIPSAEQTQRV